MTGLVVQKFGGSSVADPEKLAQVAGFIKNSLAKYPKICVVVSAMGHSTNQLIALAQQINPDPPKREMDMLISCGERSSMSLLAMALAKLQIKAVSLTGSQSGIITTEEHSGAQIIAVRPTRVLEAFRTHQVVIVAGFQGISQNKEITTLRRGGSDTTAVAMAAALNADACEIYSDVPGVLNMDPKISARAKTLPRLSFSEICAMSLYGAKVLAYDAAIIAKENNINLILSDLKQNNNTVISDEINIKNNSNSVKAITHLRGVLKLKLEIDKLDQLSSVYILCARMIDNYLHAYTSNDLAQELHSNTKTSSGLCLITIHLNKRDKLTQIIKTISSSFSDKNIVFEDIIVGFDKIFVAAQDEHLNLLLEIFQQNLMGPADENL